MAQLPSTSLPAAAMSIDVEDWFHVENLRHVTPPGSWDQCELRVQANVQRMLAILDEQQVKATFFVLGWVAQRLPQVVRSIAEGGHEVASHGYNHELVYSLRPEAFRQDVTRAKALLEDICGRAVRGYRAPCFSITDWAIDILRDTGHTYDASAFPVVAHDRYGKLTGIDGEKTVVALRPWFYEACAATLTVRGRAIPWAGGGYFRLMPYRLFRHGVQRLLAEGRPYVFYLHPWEIDPGQPRVRGLTLAARTRHYMNLSRTESRWRRLLGEFRWTTVAKLIEHTGGCVSRPVTAAA